MKPILAAAFVFGWFQSCSKPAPTRECLKTLEQVHAQFPIEDYEFAKNNCEALIRGLAKKIEERWKP